MKKLEDTNSSGISTAMLEQRRLHGSPAMGMVMTMVIVVDEEDAEESVAEAIRLVEARRG